MKIGRKLFFLAAYAQALVLLFACAGLKVSTEVQMGRIKLLHGDTRGALADFQQAATLDPNYVTDFTLLYESVWTYVGRAYFAAGQLSDAQRALEQARARHPDDHMAKLYLGLTLARTGERQKGLPEIRAGLSGLRLWLDSVRQDSPEGEYWDSVGELRSEISNQLALISGKQIDWPELISRAEWLGIKLEEEYDLAKRAEHKDQWEGGGD